MGNVNMEAHQIHCKGNKTLADKLVEFDALAVAVDDLEKEVEQKTVTVTKEENDTCGTMLARLAGFVNFDKIKPTSTLVVGTSVLQLVTWTSSRCDFQGGTISVGSNYCQFYSFTVSATPNVGRVTISGSTPTISMNDTTSAEAPDAMTIYY